MMIKTSHSCAPKKWFKNAMSDMPGGSWIVMEGIDEIENLPLICISYNYSKKLYILTTKGAGTIKKENHIMKNICISLRTFVCGT